VDKGQRTGLEGKRGGSGEKHGDERKRTNKWTGEGKAVEVRAKDKDRQELQANQREVYINSGGLLESGKKSMSKEHKCLPKKKKKDLR